MPLDGTALDIGTHLSLSSMPCSLLLPPGLSQVGAPARNNPPPPPNTALALANSYSSVVSPFKHQFLWVAFPRPWTGLGVPALCSHDTLYFSNHNSLSIIVSLYLSGFTFNDHKCLLSAQHGPDTVGSALHATLRATLFPRLKLSLGEVRHFVQSHRAWG